jgi:hypothetical protein
MRWMMLVAVMSSMGCGGACPQAEAKVLINDPALPNPGVECVDSTLRWTYSYNHTIPSMVPQDVYCAWSRASYHDPAGVWPDCTESDVYVQATCDRPNVGCRIVGVTCSPPTSACE